SLRRPRRVLSWEIGMSSEQMLAREPATREAGPAEAPGEAPAGRQEWRENLLRCLLTAMFLLFFQAYMVAPLIPRLAQEFQTSRERVGLVVSAYLLPYAIGTIVWGLLADRLGRSRVLFFCVPAFAVCCALGATAPNLDTLILWRIATGVSG